MKGKFSFSEVYSILFGDTSIQFERSGLLERLFGPLIEAQSLKNQFGKPYSFDAASASRLVSGKADFPSSFRRAVTRALNSKTKRPLLEVAHLYRETHPFKDLETVKDGLLKIVNESPDLSSSEKSNLNELANDDIPAFLSRVVLLSTLFDSLRNPHVKGLRRGRPPKYGGFVSYSTLSKQEQSKRASAFAARLCRRNSKAKTDDIKELAEILITDAHSFSPEARKRVVSSFLRADENPKIEPALSLELKMKTALKNVPEALSRPFLELIEPLSSSMRFEALRALGPASREFAVEIKKLTATYYYRKSAPTFAILLKDYRDKEASLLSVDARKTIDAFLLEKGI